MTGESGRALDEALDSERVRDALGRYVAALAARNAMLNLTGAKTPEAIQEHLRDSLALVPHVRGPLIDIGSGGGFPGIPLAIATGFKITLVESIAKKASFLRDVVSELELPVEVINGRAEELGRDPSYRARFASATARAVGGVTTVLELTIPLLAIGGVAVLQRGTFDALERASASDALLVLGATLESEFLCAPGDDATDARRVLVVRKVEMTGGRFPRRAGVPAKRPLCAKAPAR